MNRTALFHHANSEWGYALDGRTLSISFRTAAENKIVVDLVEYNRFQDYRGRRAHPMAVVAEDRLYRYHRVDFAPANHGCIYYFRIVDDHDVWYYGEYGLQREEPVRMGAFETPRIQDVDRFEAPAWMNDAIFYQIYPDRFCRVGADDPRFERWGGTPTFWNLFGGNFQGIESKIPHLVALGVNAIYLTPISLSPSSHRYDTTDYLTIDPRLGTDADFGRLVKALHAAGIRIILDAVYNHCGSGFFAFRDVLEHQEKSVYRDWFLIERFPVAVVRDKTYETFGYEPHMPKLNSGNPDVQDYLIRAGKHYVERFDIDGWRLDVADEVDSIFWRRFRAELKAVKRDLAIIGEVWHNADYYLRGDQFDSVQNYQFYELVDDFFLRRRTDLDTFRDRLTHLSLMYPENVAKVLLNALDSHDVPRAKTQANLDVKRLKMAILFQFTFPGMPCVYYGSEIGMEGGYDPDNRRTMDWDETNWDRDLLEFYRRLATWRNKEAVLRHGTFRLLHHPSLLVYERSLDVRSIRIVINPGNEPQTYDFTADRGFEDAVGSVATNTWTVLEAVR